ncbi:unnamed protein product, partial [Scytosiphon promiscuus]
REQKWSKGKVREKVANQVLFNEDTYVRCLAEVPKMKLITASRLVKRLKVNGWLARAAIRELEGKELIRKVDAHHAQIVYTRATNVEG